MFEKLVKMTVEQQEFLDSVRTEMVNCLSPDQRRIDHALQVTAYARDLLAYIDADPILTLTAAYLHDIGIHEAERRHGSSAGNWQEVEGPPLVREILVPLGADGELVESVAEIVGKHHTTGGVDRPEFRILWDADALVNFAEPFLNKTDQQIEGALRRHMVTEAGYRMARNIFLQDPEDHKRCLTGHRPAILP